MLFADQLREKSATVDIQNNIGGKVNKYISSSVAVIYYHCIEAAERGKNEIDGFVSFHPHGDHYLSEKIPTHLGDSALVTELNRVEEEKVIVGIRKEISNLGFCDFEINSYHPEQLISRYKLKGLGLFGPPKRVPIYSHTDGFCIEVHVKW